MAAPRTIVATDIIAVESTPESPMIASTIAAAAPMAPVVAPAPATSSVLFSSVPAPVRGCPSTNWVAMVFSLLGRFEDAKSGTGLRLSERRSVLRQQLEDMAVRIAEVDASAAVSVVDLAVVERMRPAAVRDACLPDALEDGVELLVADAEGVVVPLEALAVLEVERQRVVHAHRRERAHR